MKHPFAKEFMQDLLHDSSEEEVRKISLKLGLTDKEREIFTNIFCHRKKNTTMTGEVCTSERSFYRWQNNVINMSYQRLKPLILAVLMCHKNGSQKP